MSGQGLTVAVLGAGNGGQAMAGLLASKGCRVRITDLFTEKLSALRRKGTVDVEGVFNASGPVAVLDDPAECVDGAELVVMATAAPGHLPIIEKAAPSLADGQILFVTPGYWASRTVPRHMRQLGFQPKLTYVETESFIYACRAVEPGRVVVSYEKDEMGLAVSPTAETDRVLKLMRGFYPQLKDRSNMWVVTLQNINYSLHTCVTMFNAGWVDNTGGDWMFYKDGLSERIARVIDAFDSERINIGKAAGLKIDTTYELLQKFYTVEQGDSLTALIRNNPAYQTIKAPESIDYRYLTEDVPFGLVPMVHLARVLGLQTPVMDSLIQMASVLLETDFWETGLNLKDLGLEGLSIESLIRTMRGETV